MAAEVIRGVEYILSIWTVLCRILEGVMPGILPVPSLSRRGVETNDSTV